MLLWLEQRWSQGFRKLLWLEQRWSQEAQGFRCCVVIGTKMKPRKKLRCRCDWNKDFRCCCDWNKDEAKVLESCCDWNKDEAKVLDAVVIGTKMKPRMLLWLEQRWSQGFRCCCDWNKDEAKVSDCCDWNKDEAFRWCCDWNKDEAKVLDAVVIGTKLKPRF